VSTLRDNWNLPDGTTEEELTTQRSFFRGPGVRYASALVVIGLLFVAGAYWFFGGDGLPPPKPRQDTITIIIRPPPPPPPPPPEQKMIEQPKMAEQEFKEDKPDEKPPEPKPDNEANAKDEPPGPATLNAPVGPGGLLPQGKGGGGGGGGSGGSRWGYYAAMVQSQIESALAANSRTRKAVLQVQIRLWADGTGRVNRVQLMSSTGDAELDAIIRNEVLGSLMLREPPPKDMPMPMVTRVTERRPG
jgi:periplasmic protein TonB